MSQKITFSTSTYKKLLVAGLITDPSEIEPAIALCTLFQRDYNSLIKTLERSGMSLHDLGQFDPKNVNPKWIPLVTANPRILSQSSAFPVIEELGLPIPKTTSEFKVCIEKANLEGKIFVIEGRVFNDEDRETYQEFFEENKNKEFSNLPVVKVVQENYTLTNLEKDDKLAPAIGLFTNCCQHVAGYASICAKRAWTDPDCGVWVVRKSGQVISQSFVWRSDEDWLILDSVETLISQDHDKIALLYQQAARQAVGQLGIVGVAVSDADNSGTSAVRALAGKQLKKRPKYKFPENDVYDHEWYTGDMDKAFVLAE